MNLIAKILLSILFLFQFQNQISFAETTNKQNTISETNYHTLLKLAEEGNAEAQCILGNMYHDGLNIEKDQKQALKWFRKAADQGFIEALIKLSREYRNGHGVPKDPVASTEWLKKAANKNNAEAQRMLGIAYYNGFGTTKDVEKAVQWLLKAAEQGNQGAQNTLGSFYEKGTGVSQDYGEAAKWFLKAAEQGSLNSQHKLGILYHKGRGVPQNTDEAIKWFVTAAEKEWSESPVYLAEMYMAGDGVKQDYKQAAKWYLKSAQLKNFHSQIALGKMYRDGQGVPQNSILAYMWFKRAGILGMKYYQKIEKNMSSSEIAEAKKKAKEPFEGSGEQSHTDPFAAAREALDKLQKSNKKIEQRTTEHEKRGVSLFTQSQKAYDEGNDEEGLKHLVESALLGHADAQHFLSVKYAKGEQVPKNEKFSFELAEKAAKQGHFLASYQMYLKYGLGKGVEKNESKGHDWLVKSVTNGNSNPRARYFLGHSYIYAIGTKVRPFWAANWLRLAAAEGHEESAQLLALLEKEDVMKNAMFKDCENCPEMARLPQGTFLMGLYDPLNEDVKANTLLQRHFVNLPHTFSMGRTEVTYGQWDECVKDKVCRQLQRASHESAEHPVVNVSWMEAKAYAAWLAKKTGKPYRLPSESEWEYAARSGMHTFYYFGKSFPENRVNCKNCQSQWSDKSTAPVRSFTPNGYGLYDTMGNVAEWTADCYNPHYKKKPPMGIPWLTGVCQIRMVRGGAWDLPHKTTRVHERDSAGIQEHRKNLGFRVALTLKDSEKRIAAIEAETMKAKAEANNPMKQIADAFTYGYEGDQGEQSSKTKNIPKPTQANTADTSIETRKKMYLQAIDGTLLLKKMESKQP